MTAAADGMTQAGAIARIPLRVLATRVGYGLFAMFIFFASWAFIEPSPYDLLAPLTLIIWFLIGLRISVYHLVPIILLLLYNLGGFISLVPYLDEPLSVTFMVQSLYLAITAIFFALFFREDTVARMTLAFRAYAVSCVFTAVCGIIGYFDIAGLGETFSMYDRASGTFKDPNVFGSFLTPGALYLMHGLLTGRTKRPLLAFVMLLVILSGILLSFSRGSWGGTIVSSATMILLTFITAGHGRTRRRIVLLGAATLTAAALAIVALISIPEVGEIFAKRATVTQDYDEGETGRFGNQLRSLPMLLEAPNGLGPLRFRVYFDLDPHNSYINAFASYGWLGGFAFIGLMLSSFYVGFRLCVSPSPFRPLAQVAWPALMMFFLQALQIDIDHWRHVYMLVGMVWGLEAARRAWLDREMRAGRAGYAAAGTGLSARTAA